MMYIIYGENVNGEESVVYNLVGNKNAAFVDSYPEPKNKRYGKQRTSILKYSDINDAKDLCKRLSENMKVDLVIREWRTATGIGKIVD